MTRIVRDWTPSRVADSAIAPHRYLWKGAPEIPAVEYPKGADRVTRGMYEHRHFMKHVEYHIGDVIYLEHNGAPILARVLRVFAERNRHDELVAKYRVQLATKSGLWSKVWIYAHPGPVQRGYQLAGLAPEMPPRGKQ